MERTPRVVALSLLALFSGVLDAAFTAPKRTTAWSFCASAAAQSVITIPGNGIVFAGGISSDGSVAVGGYQPAGDTHGRSFIWTASGGRYDFGAEAGFGANNTTSLVSANGGVVVGQDYFNGQVPATVTYRWTGPGTRSVIPMPPPDRTWFSSYPNAMSGDSNVIIGEATSTIGDLVFWRWTPSTGTQYIPYGSRGISSDGSTILGDRSDGRSSLYRNGTTTLLPLVPGSNPANSTSAGAANNDGSIIVGGAGLGPLTAAMWTNSVGSLLPMPTGAANSLATGLSDDGSVIVGRGGYIMGNSSTSLAVIWTPSRGGETLASYFASFGLDFSGYDLVDTRVTPDGHTFFVNAKSRQNTSISNAFIVNVPASPGLAVFGVLACLGKRRR